MKDLFKLIDEANQWPRPSGSPNAEQWLIRIKEAADALLPRLQEQDKLFSDMAAELQNAADMADESPFLALGQFVEHYSNIRAVLTRARGPAPEAKTAG